VGNGFVKRFWHALETFPQVAFLNPERRLQNFLKNLHVTAFQSFLYGFLRVQRGKT